MGSFFYTGLCSLHLACQNFKHWLSLKIYGGAIIPLLKGLFLIWLMSVDGLENGNRYLLLFIIAQVKIAAKIQILIFLKNKIKAAILNVLIKNLWEFVKLLQCS